MEETKRIASLFEELYDGEPWLEITLAATLKDISAEQAAKKMIPGVNSIWEITNHMISWRKNILQRVNNIEIVTPAHNYFEPVKETSPEAWQQTLKAFEETSRQWALFFSNLNDSALEDIYPANGYTHYEHIHGIIQHDAYHLGQIVLLAKHFV